MKKETLFNKEKLTEDSCMNKIIFKTTDTIRKCYNMNFQERIEDYFLRESKEIKYFFIFNNDKTKELDNLIKQEKNTDRILEFELLKHGFSYNEEDVKKYCLRYTEKGLYEIINFDYKLGKFRPYNLIKFVKIDSDNFEIHKIDINETLNTTIKLKGDIDEEYSKYLEILKINRIKKISGNKRNRTFKLKEGGLTEISNFIKESDENYNKIKFFIHNLTIKKELKKKNLNKFEGKEELSEIFESKESKYYFYLKVVSKYIDTNIEILKTNEPVKFDKDFNMKYHIYGITLDGRPLLTKNTNTHGGLFDICYKVYNTGIKKIISHNGILELLKLDFTDGIKMDFSEFKNGIEEVILNESNDKILKKVRERLVYFTNVEIRGDE